MTDPTPKTIAKGVYRHTKSGKLYEVLGVALLVPALLGLLT